MGLKIKKKNNAGISKIIKLQELEIDSNCLAKTFLLELLKV